MGRQGVERIGDLSELSNVTGGAATQSAGAVYTGVLSILTCHDIGRR